MLPQISTGGTADFLLNHPLKYSCRRQWFTLITISAYMVVHYLIPSVQMKCTPKYSTFISYFSFKSPEFGRLKTEHEVWWWHLFDCQHKPLKRVSSSCMDLSQISPVQQSHWPFPKSFPIAVFFPGKSLWNLLG